MVPKIYRGLMGALRIVHYELRIVHYALGKVSGRSRECIHCALCITHCKGVQRFKGSSFFARVHPPIERNSLYIKYLSILI